MADKIDFEKFRLRRFVDHLAGMGEIEFHDAPVALSDLAGLIEASDLATHFKSVGPEQFEMVAGIMSSRARLAAAFGVPESHLVHEYLARLATPQAVIEVDSAVAPVHEKILLGDDADLTKLPFYLQHEFDGATYISAAMDFTVDPVSGKRNVGFRRLMLKGKRMMRANLTQISDLKRIYLEAVARGEKLPVSFVIGAHPLDCLAAAIRVPGDEFALLGQLRGEAVPMVKGVTNGILVPADAELVIEGYFDERGHAEIEGPYGELYGLYGPMHPDPVFHVTAITMRKDALHHTLLHGGKHFSRNDAANMSSLDTEAKAWRVLMAAGLNVTAIHAPQAGTGLHHLRAAIRQTAPGQAREAIKALFELRLLKHIFIVDHDIDVFSDADMERAMCTRFQVDRDIVVEAGHPTLTMDPTGDHGKQAVAGFDMTRDFTAPDIIENRESLTPRLKETKRYNSILEALASRPMFFVELMEALGTDDGRQLAVELGTLQEAGKAGRLPTSEWALEK